MVDETIHAGQLNYQVEILKKVNTANNVGESTFTLESLGHRFVKRSSKYANDNDDDGRVISLNVVAYVFRYEPFLMQNKNVLVIRDFTGDYYVTGIEVLANGRKRFLEIKGMKRE